MKRLGMTIAVVAGLAMFMLAVPTEVSAELIPCCEGGFKPDKKCGTDANCPNICVGGFQDGKNCGSGGNCKDACVGGSKDGLSCTSDDGCPGGTCSNIGTCNFGTCTALCEKKRPKPTPSEPVMAWAGDILSAEHAEADVPVRPCP